MPVVTPSKTTLAASMSASQDTFKLTSASGMAARGVLVIGNEILTLTAVDTTTGVVKALRGREGSRARKHVSGVDVYYFPRTGGYFWDSLRNRVAVQGYDGYLADPILPLGSEWTDPDTGFIYKSIDAGAAFIAGEWVVIDGSGLAAQLALGSKGFVGIITEAVPASDQMAWALIVGQFASALFDSDVTTAMQLGAAAGFAAPFDSTNHVLIERATCTVAPSTATSPTVGEGVGTALINRPYVSGVATFVS